MESETTIFDFMGGEISPCDLEIIFKHLQEHQSVSLIHVGGVSADLVLFLEFLKAQAKAHHGT